MNYSIEDVYPLEDIVKALKTSGKLRFSGIDALKCPTESKGKPIHPKSCPGRSIECKRCQDQDCKQSLTVYSDNLKLVTLTVRFYIYIKSGPGPGIIPIGFIPKEDSQLNTLMARVKLTI